MWSEFHKNTLNGNIYQYLYTQCQTVSEFAKILKKIKDTEVQSEKIENEPCLQIIFTPTVNNKDYTVLAFSITEYANRRFVINKYAEKRKKGVMEITQITKRNKVQF